MVQSKFIQMLLDNGFSYHTHPDYKSILVIENIDTHRISQQIKYIEVKIVDHCLDKWSLIDCFYIFINLKDDCVNALDLCESLDLSMYSYHSNCFGKYLSYESDKNGFIEELHRLNFTGLNIKG